MNEENDHSLCSGRPPRNKIEDAKGKLRAVAERVMVKIEQIEGRTLGFTTDKRRLFPQDEKYQIYGALDEVVDLIVEHLSAMAHTHEYKEKK